MPATTAAQAPVPQASVSPAPRSYTRSRMPERSTTCMKPAFTRCGKRGWCSISGPCSATGALSTSATTCTACGLPIDRIATETIAPSARAESARCHFSQEPSGMRIEPRPVEWNALRLEHRRPHVDRDAAVGADARLDDARQRLHPHHRLVGQPVLAHEAQEATRAVAALLDLAAVGVVDQVAEVDAGRRLSGEGAAPSGSGRRRRRSGDAPDSGTAPRSGPGGRASRPAPRSRCRRLASW